MSLSVSDEVVPRGETTYQDQAWELKEHIRAHDDVFHQTKDFFMDSYLSSRVYCYVETATDTLIGFASVDPTGYILFLAVHPDYRGNEFGKRLVHRAFTDYGPVTCHVRTTNTNAIGFYDHLGFTRHRTIQNYYEDGGDAYLLRLDHAPL